MDPELDPARDDVEGHRLASNDSEVIVRRPTRPVDDDAADDADVEGHRLAANDSEIVVRPGPRPTTDRPAD